MTAGIEAENGTDGFTRNLIPLKKVHPSLHPDPHYIKSANKGTQTPIQPSLLLTVLFVETSICLRILYFVKN